MSVSSKKNDDEKALVETRDWGECGVVFVEEDNMGAYIIDKNGSSVDLEEMA